MRAPFLCMFLLWLSCNTRPKPVDIGRNRVPGRLDFGYFTIKAPPDWKMLEEEGNDDAILGITNGKDTLFVDHLKFNQPFETPSDGRLYAMDTIDGFSVIVGIPKQQKEGFVELAFDEQPYNALHISGYVKDISVAFSIFESIHLPTGDPSKTGRLTLDRFKPWRLFSVSEGYPLFRENCGSCHHKYKWIIGPPLSPEYVKEKGEKWIIDWLGQKPAGQRDSTRLYCIRAPGLGREKITAIVKYMKASQKTYEVDIP